MRGPFYKLWEKFVTSKSILKRHSNYNSIIYIQTMQNQNIALGYSIINFGISCLVYYISEQNILINVEHNIRISFDNPNFNDQEDKEIWTSVSYQSIF